MSKAFFEHYDRWQADATAEFLDSEFNQDDAYTADDLTICENGDVHIQGNLFAVVKRAVCPWERSPHYVR